MSWKKHVNFAGRGFWVYEVALGVFLKYLIDAAEACDQAKTPWLTERISDWRVSACIGDLALSLDDEWSAAQRGTFIALAEEACSMLSKRASIPAEEMMAWRVLDGEGISTRGETEVPTAPVIELGRALISLVSGEFPEEPDGHWFIYSLSGRGTIKRAKLP